ncbi:MAG: hypothetical protein IJ343_07570 [Clostridia bacterium]|nr:hypothetical protein [Clostridia bacterium]
MKRFLTMLAAMMLLAIPALAEEAEGQAAANAAYASVLLDGRKALQMEDEWHGVTGVAQGTPFEMTGAPVRFTVLDMDTYGIQEIVIELAEPESFVVLTWYEGRVYAAEIPYRGLLDLKDDGTHVFSSGAEDNGVAMLLLESDRVTVGVLAQSHSAGTGAVTYTVGGKEADQADFDAFLAEQETKLPALWYEYSADMLRLVLGQ